MGNGEGPSQVADGPDDRPLFADDSPHIFGRDGDDYAIGRGLDRQLAGSRQQWYQ